MKGKNTLLLTLLCFAATLTLKAQQSFYGLNFSGNVEFGGVYKTGSTGGNTASVYSFEGNSGAYPFYSQLCAASNGKLYGLASQGGLYGMGALYAYNPFDSTYTKLLDFNGNEKGNSPRGSLLLYNDSIMYGLCAQGGSNNEGVIFSYNLQSGAYIKHHDFSSNSSGKFPNGSLVKAGNGRLYGMCYQGGAANEGVLFEYNPATGIVSVKTHFTGNNGRNPFGSLTEAPNGLLYGMCYQGGANNDGVLFSYNPSNSAFSLRFHFSASVTGSNPYGSFTKYNDTLLYGLTFLGGNSNAGVLFEYDMVADTLVKKLDFGGGSNGRNPYGNLLKASNGRLYGMCNGGGNNSAGTLFSYQPANNTYNVVKHFSGGNDGRNPYGSLCETPDSVLYGTTYRGGKMNEGILFAYNLKNGVYRKKIDFSTAPEGKNALGKLVQAGNGMLYGLTQFGGVYNNGVLFSYNPVNDVYRKLHDFDGSNTGAKPNGGMTVASNGMLYGMCKEGGAYGNGTLFEYDPFNQSIDKLVDFNGTNGSNPLGDLLAVESGLLYGMTSYGGFDDYGVLFSFNTSNSALNKLFDFNDSSTGSSPSGSLCQGPDHLLYGLTYQGGTYGSGVFFSFDTDSNRFETKHHFGNGTDGAYPQGSVTEGSNGKYYGMTSLGGSGNSGCIWMYDPIADTLSKAADFNTSNGKSPSGSLVNTYKGTMLGVSPYGGSNASGVLFEFNPVTNTLNKTYDFSPEEGSLPFGSLCPVCLPVYSNRTISTCDSFVSFSGKTTWYSSGDYSDTLRNYTGCDSIIRIRLNIQRKTFAMVDTAVCLMYTGADANTYDSSGTYTITIPNRAGCDSIITLKLQILRSFSHIAASACSTYTAPDGLQYNSSGNYTAVIQNYRGCDSTIRIDLRILNSSASVDTVVCFSYKAPDGTLYDSSGTYEAVITNASGCDSTILIRLTVNKVNTQVTASDNVLTAQTENAAYQWLNCSNAFAPVSGENGRIFTALKNGSYAVEITENSCRDTSVCVDVTSLGLYKSTGNPMLRVYPNPGDGRLRIELGAVYGWIRVSMTDASGRMVYMASSINNASIDLNTGLSAGLYHLHLEYGNDETTQLSKSIQVSIVK